MRFFLALSLLAAFPSLAAVPEKGEGTITLQAGPRVLLPTNGTYIDQQGARHQVFQPQALIGLGYQYDDDLHFKIEIGYALDRYKLASGVDLSVRSIPIFLAIDTTLATGSWFTVFGGGGLGYSLNSANKGPDIYNEANSTAFYLALGIRMRLTEKLAVVLEDRFTLASAQVDPDPAMPKLNVGGNLLSLGLQLHFLEPEEKGHPKAP